LPRGVFQLRHPDVENGEDEVIAAKLGFAGQEGFQFKLAIRASTGGRCNNRDEEDRLRDRSIDLSFPELTGGDRLLVLPEPKRFRRAAELPPQLALDALAKSRERVPRIFVVFARVAKEADEFRKVSQG
jgi:hypothetical protein